MESKYSGYIFDLSITLKLLIMKKPINYYALVFVPVIAAMLVYLIAFDRDCYRTVKSVKALQDVVKR